ncbi:MAG TPA: PilZ domain-containing protein [Marinobacter sp.]|uniref:PilZ domain-containing protein n=1 Tax=marine sediment metagenome TaxID=412755 RepID=A0A0F9R1C0_9ZZZZ|nr:PilZ domain-containing protein [Marinobacter sp.]
MRALSSQPFDTLRRDTRHPASHLCAFIRTIETTSHKVVEGSFTESVAPLIDISESGASFISPHAMKVGQRIKVDIMGKQTKASGIKATVKRVQCLTPFINRIGVEFDSFDRVNNRYLALLIGYASLLGVSQADW